MNEMVYSEVRSLICEVLELEDSELEDNTHFVDDLNIDSILIIELKAQFEERLKIEIEKEDLPNLISLTEIISYLKNRDINVPNNA